MKDNIRPPNFPGAPEEYTKEFMDDFVRRLRLFLQEQLSPGATEVDTLRMLGLETSPSGLPQYSVWNDSGTLKIVQNVASPFVSGSGMTISVGTVTVSTP